VQRDRRTAVRLFTRLQRAIREGVDELLVQRARHPRPRRNVEPDLPRQIVIAPHHAARHADGRDFSEHSGAEDLHDPRASQTLDTTAMKDSVHSYWTLLKEGYSFFV
jgi:hypothetical protein